LKKIFLLFLVLAVLSPAFVQVGLVVYYQANKAYIAQQLCENKNNKKTNCNGHCYLTKQLKKAEEGEQKQSAKLIKEKEELLNNQHQTLPEKYFPAFLVSERSVQIARPHLPAAGTEMMKPPCA
jgi:hypothetical protein